MSDDALTCYQCGIREHVNLLDGEINPRTELATGRLLCVKCYGPGWCPTGGEEDFKLSVAPSLGQLYRAWSFNRVLIDGMRGEQERLKDEVTRLTALAVRGPDVYLDTPGPYLIWSNKHMAWHGPGGRGYVKRVAEAGRYTKSVALETCRSALGTAGHIGVLAELPVREADVRSFLAGALVPGGLL